MIEITAEREIEASAEAVWSVLTDLDQFRAWNPFIRDARGKARVGETIHLHVHPSLGVPLRFHATVLVREDNRVLRWRGRVFASWLARGDHSFTIEPLGAGRVRFSQHETFSGLVPRLAARLLARETRRGFEAMNEALDHRVHRVAEGRVFRARMPQAHVKEDRP
ncbi:MAG: Polyketide cyclase/dehydrase [Deltaproteobacteria bacterium]|nr:Polyketide cyclase/dehydrase [Deltaproteobacteria bacterium]